MDLSFSYKYSKIFIKFIGVLVVSTRKEVNMRRKYFGTTNDAQTSDIVDLSTRRSGLDFLMNYNDMVRTVRNKGIEYAKKHDPLLKKFTQFGKGYNKG